MDTILFLVNPYMNAVWYGIIIVGVFFVTIVVGVGGIFFYLKYRIIGRGQQKYILLFVQAKKKKFEQQKNEILNSNVNDSRFIKSLLLFFTRRYKCTSLDECSNMLQLKKTQKQTIKNAYYRDEQINDNTLDEIKKKIKKMMYLR